MARVFGIRPWETEQLTYWQWLRLKHHLDDMNRGR